MVSNWTWASAALTSSGRSAGRRGGTLERGHALCTSPGRRGDEGRVAGTRAADPVLADRRNSPGCLSLACGLSIKKHAWISRISRERERKAAAQPNEPVVQCRNVVGTPGMSFSGTPGASWFSKRASRIREDWVPSI